MTHALNSDLASHISGWQPEPVSSIDTITAARVAEFAATIDCAQRFGDGDELPSLWHWVFFLDWPATSDLGVDGHPRDGRFLPPIPNRRRMFAGGRVEVISPLVIGQQATRHSELVGAKVKSGRSGEMLFVAVRHSYRQGDQLRLVEELDYVYRSDDGTATSFVRDDRELGAPTTPWLAEPQPDPALLFRFSALTGNAHRIHYDERYTIATEGYPGLVVHGPLLAVYMAELLRANVSDRALSRLQFRFQRPVFLGDAIRVQGDPGESTVVLTVNSGSDTVHASATATLA